MNSRLSIATPRSPFFIGSSISRGRQQPPRASMGRILTAAHLSSSGAGRSTRRSDNEDLGLFRRRLHAFGGVERGQHDALIAGATAEIAGDRDPHLLLGRVRVIAQKFQ